MQGAGRLLRLTNVMMASTRRRLPNASSAEGSTLIEVLIGSSLFAVVILATGSGTMFSTASASIAQQRSVAATLVSRDVATTESLPFADLTAGLNPSVDPLATDPNVQTVGSTYVLKSTGATLATLNTKSSESPLVPHVATVTVRIPYKVATYPSVSSSGLVTLVVVVTWTSALGGSAQLVGETQVAAP